MPARLKGAVTRTVPSKITFISSADSTSSSSPPPPREGVGLTIYRGAPAELAENIVSGTKLACVNCVWRGGGAVECIKRRCGG